ncbi:nitrate reductase [Vibrio fluvialis]|uniref:nitrate reductase n=1 Tax=Vibrio fluvialis TaxID=676 RepID=UPI001302A38A|nr:nitrate reductase [Vibrio fluvialis]
MTQANILTTCPYCGVGCGVSANRETIVGDKTHPANQGALCVKGSALAESLNMPSRLLYPKLRGQEIQWDAAIDDIATRIHQAIEQHGPDSVAMYVSGQILTEDYYVANKLMKGYVGSANIDTNSRLCMSSAVAAHVRAFGEDVVPVNYDDIDQTDLLVLVGANTAWTHPVLFRRIQQAREQNPRLKLVVIDPRRTVTAEQADLHLAIANDGDVLLYNGLLRFMKDSGTLNQTYIDEHTQGFEALLTEISDERYQLSHVSRALDVDEEALRTFYRWFALSPTALTLFCQGVNQSVSGVDKGNAIINAHLASGKIGREGCGPFSLTGQPNAMGGREVGGLANQLAVHRGFDDIACQQVQTFWQSPTIADKPGLKALDLFDAVEAGQIKVLWIMATNPVVSLPDSDRIRRALKHCDFVIVSDITASSDVAEYADLLLPAAGWGEKQGMVTNSERRLSRQRAFLAAPGEAKPDWWAVSQVGSALCSRLNITDGFAFQSVADVFREYAGLTGINRGTPYLLDLSMFATMSDDEYERWTPVQWPLTRSAPYRDGQFSTPSGRANFIAVEPHEVPSGEWWLNTGRQRDQWHTMTRTGHIAKLAAAEVEPTLYVNKLAGQSIGLKEGEIAALRSDSQTQCVFARVAFDEGLKGKQLFMSMHWAGRYSAHSQVNRAVLRAADPISGQPAFKSAHVHLAPVTMQSYGLYVGASRTLPECDYVSYQQEERLGVTRFASLTELGKGQFELLSGEQVLRWDLPQGWMMVIGRAKADTPAMEVTGILMVSAQPVEQDYTAMVALIGKPLQLGSVLALAGETATSQLVCSCFRVTDKQIQHAMAQDGCVTLNQLQSKLKCGTNCGSCLPEVNKLLASRSVLVMAKP